MPKTFYITTAIDYTNSPPHVGHAYEKVLADVLARYRRLKGEKVFFLTGVDQHGQKVQQSAAKAGIPPAEFVKETTQKFVDLWRKLDVKYDGWAETTSDQHKKVVQGIVQRLLDEGQIYKDKQAGYYSVRQEQFLTDKERGPDGQFGLEWGEIEFREEENYYFKLCQHKEWLLSYLDSTWHRHLADEKLAGSQCHLAVIPDFRQTELRNAVERISGDLCISRPKSRLDWGIELPFDKDFVTYVWFDALTNYISFAGYDPSLSTLSSQPSTFRDKWPALQIIGKDILVPAHGIYWLIMLHAIGFPDDQMPQLLVHGWWNLGGAKMSKSVGNIIDPFVLAAKYGAESLRYYLMSDIVTGKDADFSEDRLVERYNTDLANSLGNLLNRSLDMTHRFCAGSIVQKNSRVDELLSSDPEVAHKIAFADLDNYQVPQELVVIRRGVDQLWLRHATENYEAEQVDSVLYVVRRFTEALNRMIQNAQPWVLAKVKLPERDVDVSATLYFLSESLRIIAILISPVLPKAAHGIFDQLNWKMELSGKEERFSLADAEWGRLPDGHVVGKPVPLFPRIETSG